MVTRVVDLLLVVEIDHLKHPLFWRLAFKDISHLLNVKQQCHVRVKTTLKQQIVMRALEVSELQVVLHEPYSCDQQAGRRVEL